MTTAPRKRSVLDKVIERLLSVRFIHLKAAGTKRWVLQIEGFSPEQFADTNLAEELDNLPDCIIVVSRLAFNRSVKAALQNTSHQVTYYQIW